MILNGLRSKLTNTNVDFSQISRFQSVHLECQPFKVVFIPGGFILDLLFNWLLFLFVYTVHLPKLLHLMFETKNRRLDEFRWPLLEWILGLDAGIVKQIQDKKDHHKFAVTIVTLLYLVQVDK